MSQKIGITLDPGHSYNYNQGYNKAYYESNQMYDLAIFLKAELLKYGIFDVHITKSYLKEDPSLSARGNTAILNGSRIFHSLHTNAFSSTTAKGTIIFYSNYRQKNKELSIKMRDAIVKIANENGSEETYGRDWAVQLSSSGKDYYGVIRSSVASYGVQFSFLTEHIFHTNPTECNLYLNDSVLHKTAEAIAKIYYDEMKQYYIDPSVRTYDAVTNATTYVRTEADSSSQPLACFIAGTDIKIVSKIDKWYKIICNGAAAFVAISDVNCTPSIPEDSTVEFPLPTITDGVSTVTPVEVTPSSDKILIKTTGSVLCDKLNLRSGASVSSTIQAVLTKGTNVNIVFTDEVLTDWLKIQVTLNGKNLIGYVYAEYILQAKDLYKEAKVINSSLNIRSSMKYTAYNTIKILKKNTILYALTTEVANGWYQVKLDKDDTTYYYASSKYISFINDESPRCDNAEAVLPISYSVITASLLNVRSNPSTNASVIGKLPKGYYIIIYSESNGWYEIAYKNIKAYVSKKYINILFAENTIFSQEMDSKLDIHSIEEGNCTEWFESTLGAKVSNKFGACSGVDYSTVDGNAIYTPVDGMCVFTGYNTTYGNYCILMAIDGTYHYFCNMKSTPLVSAGKFCMAGTKLGYTGSSGSAIISRLHYEIRKIPYTATDTTDPEKYVYPHTVNRLY